MAFTAATANSPLGMLAGGFLGYPNTFTDEKIFCSHPNLNGIVVSADTTRPRFHPESPQ
jgi:hypothetical protein